MFRERNLLFCPCGSFRGGDLRHCISLDSFAVCIFGAKKRIEEKGKKKKYTFLSAQTMFRIESIDDSE